MRISDWSSDVCSSDLARTVGVGAKLCMTEEGEIVRRKPFQKRLRLRVGDPVGVRPKPRQNRLPATHRAADLVEHLLDLDCKLRAIAGGSPVHLDEDQRFALPGAGARTEERR